jgi:NAD(P)-dependent dehydrogenase (short-subunit alcohol dehydrogenase family)
VEALRQAAFVIGSSRRIGRATDLAAARCGFDLVAQGRSPSSLSARIVEIRSSGALTHGVAPFSGFV